MFTLRSYQQQVIANTYQHIRSGEKRILIFAPTGAGKTIIATKADGKLLVLVSCAALSESFDVPQVSCIIQARPTKSKALYFQQLGRGLRLAPDKFDCLVLDQY